MALCRTGAYILKSVKPLLINSCFSIPSPINIQVRYAARKGYRDKVKRAKKEAAKNALPVLKEAFKTKKKFTKTEKTVNLKKPEPPNDDVIILQHFNYKKFSLSEAVKLHREYHHPTVYNNPDAPVNLKIEINMVGKSQFQFIKPFSGIAVIPHPFVISHKKEVLVLCDPADVELALSCGASIAGGLDIVKKIQEGIIQPTLYDYIISHVGFLQHLTPIRAMLKNQFPKAKIGTLTSDLRSAIYKFLHGVEYSCIKVGTSNDFGFITCNVGKISMELNQLEENFKALMADIETNKPPRDGDFITWVWCTSPPSKEEFCIDLSKYSEVLKKNSDIDDDDDDDDDDEGVSKEGEMTKKLVKDFKEEKIMSNKA